MAARSVGEQNLDGPHEFWLLARGGLLLQAMPGVLQRSLPSGDPLNVTKGREFLGRALAKKTRLRSVPNAML